MLEYTAIDYVGGSLMVISVIIFIALMLWLYQDKGVKYEGNQ